MINVSNPPKRAKRPHESLQIRNNIRPLMSKPVMQPDPAQSNGHSAGYNFLHKMREPSGSDGKTGPN